MSVFDRSEEIAPIFGVFGDGTFEGSFKRFIGDLRSHGFLNITVKSKGDDPFWESRYVECRNDVFRICMFVRFSGEQVVVGSDVWVDQVWLHKYGEDRLPAGDIRQPEELSYRDYEFTWKRNRSPKGRSLFESEREGSKFLPSGSELSIWLAGVGYSKQNDVFDSTTTGDVNSPHAETSPPGALGDYEALCTELVGLEHTYAKVPLNREAKRPRRIG